ncbi:hypothetical protein C5E45_27415 [Nocardia nova]|uniref:NERD domain-containing protein n=1 Tax=Nocardia nova TaxID=37330 RepID=A0A2S6AIX4_9NOCA|nr:NERD domain-containing protein [Nocardia nova]PPJ31639.1 hypothetical protein C5E41_06945 [Nocardia nova]PPJ35178.1 hypothetical protein C5E45_27415 [Nocardia nova]
MLIINGDITKPKTQQQVVEWLANYVTHPGIAVSGVYIPRLDGGSAEADLLVFTPHAAAVIEVDALRKKTRGPLSYSMNERWSAPGIHGDPVQLRGDDLNPLHQIRGPVSALRTFVAELTRGPEPFVDGLILLIPKSGNTVTLDKGPMPGGFTVLLGDSASQLYSWFGRTAQHRDRTPWTAELVVTVLAALRVDRTRDAESRRRLYAELVAEGFPTEVSAVRAGESRRSTTGTVSAPSDTAQAESQDWGVPNSQAVPTSSHPFSSPTDSNPAEPPAPVTSATPAASPAAKHEPIPANSSVSDAGPPSSAPSASHGESTPSPQAHPTPATASTSDPVPNAPGAVAPAPTTTHPANSAPIPSSAPPRRSDEPTHSASPSDAIAHTTPITSHQADAPEPDWTEPVTDFDPRTQPPARHRLRTALLGIAAALILVCGIGYMAGRDHPRAQSGSQPAPSQVHPPEKTTTPTPTSPIATTDRPGTSQRPATPTEGATCYPFQAGC